MAKMASSSGIRRAFVALGFSLLFLSMNNILPPVVHWATVVLILLVFIKLPDIRGMRSALVAAFLSLLLTGLGHLYIREYGRGFFFILGGTFAFMITGYSPRYGLLNVVLFIVSAIDSFSFGKRGFGIF